MSRLLPEQQHSCPYASFPPSVRVGYTFYIPVGDGEYECCKISSGPTLDSFGDEDGDNVTWNVKSANGQEKQMSEIEILRCPTILPAKNPERKDDSFSAVITTTNVPIDTPETAGGQQQLQANGTKIHPSEQTALSEVEPTDNHLEAASVTTSTRSSDCESVSGQDEKELYETQILERPSKLPEAQLGAEQKEDSSAAITTPTGESTTVLSVPETVLTDEISVSTEERPLKLPEAQMGAEQKEDSSAAITTPTGESTTVLSVPETVLSDEISVSTEDQTLAEGAGSSDVLVPQAGAQSGVYVGFTFFKSFEDGDNHDYFKGEVVYGPEEVEDENGDFTPHWRVRYVDDDEEDMTEEEILKLPKEKPVPATKRKAPKVSSTLAEAPECSGALVSRARDPSRVQVGFTFYKFFDDGDIRDYVKGEVTHGPREVEDENGDITPHWRVQFTDGEEEDITGENILALPKEKPSRAAERKSPDGTPTKESDKPPAIETGYTFWKLFEDEEFYQGTVIRGPEKVRDPISRRLIPSWRIRYEDDTEEILAEEEILNLPKEKPALPPQKKSSEVTTSKAPVIEKGYTFWKRFEDEEFHQGSVITGPEKVRDPISRRLVTGWRVRYEDDAEREITEEEILKLPKEKPALAAKTKSPKVTPRKDSDKASAIEKGYTFWKLFEDEEFYQGKVIRGPEEVKDPVTGRLIPGWRVRYEDGDMEDLTTEEILELPQENPARAAKRKAPEITPTEDSDKPPAIEKGYTFWKLFEDEEFYQGIVIRGPEKVRDPVSGRLIPSWRVRYEDDTEEDLTTEEINKCSQENPRLKVLSQWKRPKLAANSAFEAAKSALLYYPCVSEEEVERALKKVGPPYGLHAAMDHIHSERRIGSKYKNREKFIPEIGMKVRLCDGGAQYHGIVTSDARWKEVGGQKVKLWEVTYDNDAIDDMDWHQLLQAWADRPTRLNTCRGRMLYCLELFAGCGMITQEFAKRFWFARSIDNLPSSHATDKMDIMKFTFKDVGFFPDFIWASPPCFTYSRLAGGKHRCAETKEFEKTPQAHEQNHLFMKMVQIMYQAREKNRHLIVVIENPTALLAHMPLMKEFVSTFGLYKAQVHYCAFGRHDKKPTDLWTNDHGLYSTLKDFHCSSDNCPYYGGIHPVGVRGHGDMYNAAAIPQALAEEVAEYVNAKFYMDRIRKTKFHPVDDDNNVVPPAVFAAVDAETDDISSESTF